MVVVGRGQVPGMVPPVAVVVAVTCCKAAVVVIVVVVRVRVMTHILTCFLVLILNPGQTLKAMSNREHDLLLSRLLLSY